MQQVIKIGVADAAVMLISITAANESSFEPSHHPDRQVISLWKSQRHARARTRSGSTFAPNGASPGALANQRILGPCSIHPSVRPIARRSRGSPIPTVASSLVSRCGSGIVACIRSARTSPPVYANAKMLHQPVSPLHRRSAPPASSPMIRRSTRSSAHAATTPMTTTMTTTDGEHASMRNRDRSDRIERNGTPAAGRKSRAYGRATISTHTP